MARSAPERRRPLRAEIGADLISAGTSAVGNALLCRGLRNVFLRGVRTLAVDQPAFAGPAFPLRFIPAREDLDDLAGYASGENLHRRAIEECPPGFVLVLATGGNTTVAAAGDLMIRRLKARGAAGVVTDGGYRDAAAIAGLGFSACQVAAAPAATPIGLHPADLDVPVGCGGVAIYPGDVILGDGDGVLAIPRSLVREVATEAAGTTAYEEFAAWKIEGGSSLFDVFPATTESRDEYRAWAAAGRASGVEE